MPRTTAYVASHMLFDIIVSLLRPHLSWTQFTRSLSFSMFADRKLRHRLLQRPTGLSYNFRVAPFRPLGHLTYTLVLTHHA